MRKRLHPIQIVRAFIQLISFVTVPALFITIFSSIGSVIMSITDVSFVFTDNLGRIILVVGVFLTALVWGRYFCGFICSFGAMQDLLNVAGKLMPFRGKVPEKADKWLKLLKYAVLAFVAAASAAKQRSLLQLKTARSPIYLLIHTRTISSFSAVPKTALYLRYSASRAWMLTQLAEQHSAATA